MAVKFQKLYVSVHVLLAGFFLIPAFMFAITGALYTFKVTGAQQTSRWSIQAQLNQNSLADFVQLAEQQLSERGLALPTGSAAIKKMGTSWSFEWTGSQRDFLIEPTADEGTYQATLKEASWHRYFVQLHKAKGGLVFKWLAAGLAVAFVLIFASGGMLAWARPDLKRKFLIALILGGLSFIFSAALS